jgi:hypothetical protein
VFLRVLEFLPSSHPPLPLQLHYNCSAMPSMGRLPPEMAEAVDNAVHGVSCHLPGFDSRAPGKDGFQHCTAILVPTAGVAWIFALQI